MNNYLRITAKCLSLASLALIGMFAFGGDEPWNFQSAREVIGFLLFPVGISAGMILAWWNARIGGALCVASLALFYVWHAVGTGRLPTGPYFLLFASPGILFLISSIKATPAPVPSS